MGAGVLQTFIIEERTVNVNGIGVAGIPQQSLSCSGYVQAPPANSDSHAIITRDGAGCRLGWR